MRVSPSTLGTAVTPPVTGAAASQPTDTSTRPVPVGADRRFSVLNDFRYLTESDKDLLARVTGERIEPGLTEGTGQVSAFAQQLALDRRTGELAPNQQVTAVYLRNAAAAIEQRTAGNPHHRNPYSGEVMDAAVAYLESVGRGRADIRL